MNNTYFLLRHGQTPYQVEKERIIYPWPEPSPILLTKKGEEEVSESAKKLKKEKIDLIFSSDISRTRQTAGIVGQELGIEVVFDIRLRDINLGIYKGRSSEEYWQSFSNQKEVLSKRPSQGESWRDVQKRLMEFLEEIDERYIDKRILIVSHQGTLWFLEGTVKGLNDNDLILGLKGKGLPTGQFRELKIYGS